MANEQFPGARTQEYVRLMKSLKSIAEGLDGFLKEGVRTLVEQTGDGMRRTLATYRAFNPPLEIQGLIVSAFINDTVRSLSKVEEELLLFLKAGNKKRVHDVMEKFNVLAVMQEPNMEQ